jgi:carbon starvation protein
MVVVSFALTSLDSATRLLRFNVEEIGSSIEGALTRGGTRSSSAGEMIGALLSNRYVAAGIACASIALFAFYKVQGPDPSADPRPAALALWVLFGTTNQLLAALTLILASLYLRYRRWPVWPTGIPAVFMMISTLIAMVQNLVRFGSGEQPNMLLLIVGALLLLLGVWLVIESIIVFWVRRDEKTDRIEVFEEA